VGRTHAPGQTTDAVSNPWDLYSTSRLFRKPTPQPWPSSAFAGNSAEHVAHVPRPGFFIALRCRPLRRATTASRSDPTLPTQPKGRSHLGGDEPACPRPAARVRPPSLACVRRGLEPRSEETALIATALLLFELLVAVTLIHIDLTRQRKTPIKGQMGYRNEMWAFRVRTANI
jgi:hypothetical protein